MADEKVITEDEHLAGVVDPEATVGQDINLDSAVDGLAASLKLADATEKPETPEVATEGQGSETDVTPQPEAAAAAAPAPAGGDRAPDTWTPAAQAKWAAIDPEIRAEVQKRE